MAALSYLVKMGGTRNIEMIALAKQIWLFLIRQGITLIAEYLPGSLNVKADWASWNFQDASGWLLCRQAFLQICQI